VELEAASLPFGDGVEGTAEERGHIGAMVSGVAIFPDGRFGLFMS